MSIHLAVLHRHRGLCADDFLDYAMSVPELHDLELRGYVKVMTTRGQNLECWITWFMLITEEHHPQSMFIVLDPSMVPEGALSNDIRKAQFKHELGQGIAFWLETIQPVRYDVHMIPDGRVSVAITVVDMAGLTAHFNAAYKGKPQYLEGAHGETEGDPGVPDA